MQAPVIPIKLCKGCNRKLEINTDNWFFRDGKPTGRCRECRARLKTQHDGPYGWVEAKKVYPLMQELVARYGSVTKASEASEISETAIRSIIDRKRPRVQKKTVRLVVLALHEKRKSDRRNGAGEIFLEMKRKQAEIEERINRLAGY